MTASSIGAAKAGGYARYLEGKTLAPERGDYYLAPSGEPAQAPGRWLTSSETLARLGIEDAAVDGPDFIALMEGRHPGDGSWLRREGAGGGRGGGIDVTFSAPKSVSVMWALGDEGQRRDMEAAHASAVERAVGYLAETVPTVRRRYGGGVVEEPARELIAAEYLHTTARGVMDGDAPDPQLHSHVVITSAVRDDGRIVAVASRPVFRSARELGAFYRSALASELSERGYAIDAGTGNDGRYFEIAGVPQGLLDAFSARSREVAGAAERFRAKWGRAPERGELRRLKLENRKAKIPVTRMDLQRVWEEKAARHGFPRERRNRPTDGCSRREGLLEDRVEERLTERAATFEPGELRAVLLEQSVGELAPEQALARTGTMIAERRVLPLEGGRLTTLAVRAKEQAIERRIAQLARPASRDVGRELREVAADQLAERIGARLSVEQSRALEAITGPERVAILIGPAGTGKGVVIDAAARAEHFTGHCTYGIAVSGSTAQRLGQDSPALTGQTLTLDALIARTQSGRLVIDERTTIFFDEAGMADTSRLDRLTAVVERSGAKLVLVGDGAQLPSIGAGGMFDRLTHVAPSAQLSNVRRTLDPGEQKAWADLRAGRSDRAMAHYLRQGRLHMTDTRDQAVERAVHDWATLTETIPMKDVALISDASNVEINRLNARAQHHRAQRGELGELEVEVPGVHYGIRAGDRVSMIDQHHRQGTERIENGAQGEVIDIDEAGQVLIQFDATNQWRTLAGDDLARLRLGYAQHIHRAQGATVTRTLVVTGGWQTSKEPAYVEASRARQGTDWYVNREDLGSHGHDLDRIKRLSRDMGRGRVQTPSLAYREPHGREWDAGLDLGIESHGPERYAPRLPGVIRALHRAAPAASTGADTMTSEKRIRRTVPRLAFNQQEAAEALGISVDHFARQVKLDLPVVYSGSLRLYPRQALESWLSEHTIQRGRRVA
ncbi:MAG TPA: MobF family relaxase [Solirubrobacteraceae bacterium]|nr:MobF family relaxase [Solirubrobacteraceae bacterium]